MNYSNKSKDSEHLFSIILAVLLVLLLGLVIIDKTHTPKVNVSYGNSVIYSTEEIDAAVQAVKEDFKNLDGCKLYSLSYAGDQDNEEEIKYINEFGKYDKCIVFNSEFRSPLFGGGAWTSNTIYTWKWYVGRNEHGSWEVVQKGYD